jgi:hypothetical protein
MYDIILETLAKKRPNSFSVHWNDEWGYYNDAVFNEKDDPVKYAEWRAEEANRKWKVCHYDKTPVGFVEIEGSSFDEVMKIFVAHLVQHEYLSSEDFEDEKIAVAFKLMWE